jgi:hypothetical protein
MDPKIPLPSLKSVERALRATTERLALECACPSTIAPKWDDFHWCMAQSVASMQGISPLLALRLRWQGPAAWQEYLQQQSRHTFARHQGIERLAGNIDAAAREAKLAIVALKGLALHDLGVYAPGTRPMADVDLLVNEPDAAATVVLLASLGYKQSYATRRERTFEPRDAGSPIGFGEHCDNAIKIELHTQIAEWLPVRIRSISELLLPRRTDVGLRRSESPAALMTHLLLHAAGNMRTRSLRMIQLNDIAELCSHLGADGWQRVLAHERAGRSGWVFPPLALTARYYPGVIAPELLARASGACPRWLRHVCRRQRLTDVSLSYLWIQFCPGIEWCHSLTEAVEYMQQRAFPDRATRAEVRQSETMQPWLVNSPWSRSSRTRRVVRWAFSRPPRVATMWSVQAACEHSGADSGQVN